MSGVGGAWAEVGGTSTRGPVWFGKSRNLNGGRVSHTHHHSGYYYSSDSRRGAALLSLSPLALVSFTLLLTALKLLSIRPASLSTTCAFRLDFSLPFFFFPFAWFYYLWFTSLSMWKNPSQIIRSPATACVSVVATVDEWTRKEGKKNKTFWHQIFTSCFSQVVDLWISAQCLCLQASTKRCTAPCICCSHLSEPNTGTGPAFTWWHRCDLIGSSADVTHWDCLKKYELMYSATCDKWQSCK